MRMRKRIAGFTLLETIVAIVILSIALSGAVSMIVVAVREVHANKDRMTALYLTQECLELTRNVRDSSWKRDLPWDCALYDPDNPDTVYTIAPGNSNLPARCKSTNSLGIDIKPYDPSIPTSGRVDIHGNATPFTRTLQTKKDANALTISCHTQWQSRGRQRKISLSHILTPWKQQ